MVIWSNPLRNSVLEALSCWYNSTSMATACKMQKLQHWARFLVYFALGHKCNENCIRVCRFVFLFEEFHHSSIISISFTQRQCLLSRQSAVDLIKGQTLLWSASERFSQANMFLPGWKEKENQLIRAPPLSAHQSCICRGSSGYTHWCC